MKNNTSSTDKDIINEFISQEITRAKKTNDCSDLEILLKYFEKNPY